MEKSKMLDKAVGTEKDMQIKYSDYKSGEGKLSKDFQIPIFARDRL